MANNYRGCWNHDGAIRGVAGYWITRINQVLYVKLSRFPDIGECLFRRMPPRVTPFERGARGVIGGRTVFETVLFDHDTEDVGLHDPIILQGAAYPPINKYSTRFKLNEFKNFLKSFASAITIECPSQAFQRLQSLDHWTGQPILK